MGNPGEQGTSAVVIPPSTDQAGYITGAGEGVAGEMDGGSGLVVIMYDRNN